MHTAATIAALCGLVLFFPGYAGADEAAPTPGTPNTLAPPACNYGAPNANAPPELAQFDFLIGDYTVSAHAWRDGEWTVPRPGVPARWNGRYGLDGMSIIDDWYDRDPGSDPKTDRGINVRMYDPEAGEWDMMWIHTGNHQVQDLRAKVIDGKLTMWQVYPERADFRAYFNRLGPDRWQRVSLVPGKAEDEWVPQYKLVATRIPCPET